MKLADQIILHLLKHGRRDPNEIMIPNFYLYRYEMDLFKLTKDQFIVEYEVKITRSDFFNDFKKYHTEYGEFHEASSSWKDKHNVYKHDHIRTGAGPNRFVFVVPEGMVSLAEVPRHCGLMYCYVQDEKVWSIQTERPAPMLHKNKFTDYQRLAKSLSWREDRWRRKFYKV